MKNIPRRKLLIGYWNLQLQNFINNNCADLVYVLHVITFKATGAISNLSKKNNEQNLKKKTTGTYLILRLISINACETGD